MSSLNVEHAREVLSSAESVLVHSGNIASWNKLRRKGVLTPTDEVSVCGARRVQRGRILNMMVVPSW